ncbi:carbohydrate kinase [Streptomyces malaysiensis subsp. malaysiensis]|uniref:FGGY-family carbohydrate kinase n=1 Tax=Streptomyces malaysiensis TaxID=92644 RepID=UPI000BFB510B|nr:FGGY-family carbohydrate kinase [Streptomyces malaysiensis]ATL81298.1 putative erythritol kinase protein [Streptomyces malaysiensis]QDL74210.1 carbohydrate kinase [Streptomyces malaysiensis]
MIVGVDIGTSVTKAQLISRDGRTTPAHEARSTVYTLPGQRVEQDLDDVVGTVETVVRAALGDAAQLGGEPVEALALTGQGDGLWLRDAKGAPVGRALSWMDGRAADRVDRWAADGTLHALHRRTGVGLFPGSAAPLLAHLAEHEPERLAAADVAGYCVDAVVQRLTGAVTVDVSDASQPFLDVATRTYDETALELCGLSAHRRLLPDPAPPSTLHRMLPDAARRLGLPAGLPVSAGPFDIPACAFGSGVAEPGEGNLIIGTTLAAQVLDSEPRPAMAEDPAGMVLATPYENRYLRVMPAMIGTAGLDWLLKLLDVKIEALDALLVQSPPGAAGVTALPFLSTSGERAPFVDPRARGRFDGLSPLAGRADLVRALCEAVAYSARHCMETLGVTGTVTACGGGARSGEWARVFAGVLGGDLEVCDDAVGIRGAAHVAWRSLGTPVDPGAWRARLRTVTAERGLIDHYAEGYAAYRHALDLAREGWSTQ